MYPPCWRHHASSRDGRTLRYDPYTQAIHTDAHATVSAVQPIRGGTFGVAGVRQRTVAAQDGSDP
ncbi:hypothetical protein CUJ88_01245 [Paraburkholderia hospita]|uniref:Uncharacterized protein n=1 Tax=Paraburkholderia hospita TaxID=169430 RepID=A0AAN1MHD8_9BURK|nr:hypothetical protein C2L64_01505 [Paraburkholderia hospita]AXE97252.1 hypothetical protein CUJ88_01245 [Paraburkholderia hospita]OUL68591.1 hypothetical protein CA602_51280 [Paraburkholderia hospita]